MNNDLLQRRKTKKTVKDETVYRCKDCGSYSIEGVFWVPLNTKIPRMSDLYDKYLKGSRTFFCPDCNKNVQLKI